MLVPDRNKLAGTHRQCSEGNRNERLHIDSKTLEYLVFWKKILQRYELQ